MYRRNIYDSVSLSLYLSLLVGFFPIYIGNSGRRKIAKTDKYCALIIFIYLTIFTIMLYLASTGYNPVTDGDIYNFNTLAKLLILVVTIIGDVSTYVILIQSYFYRNKFRDFFNTIATVDRQLAKIGHRFNHDTDFFTYMAINLTGLVLMLCNLGMQLWNIRRGFENVPRIPHVLLFCHIFAFTFIHQGESMFVMSNTVLLRRFEAINFVLRKLHEKALMRKSYNNGQKKISITNDITRTSRSDENILDICVHCHDKLSDLRDVVNKIFGYLTIVGSVIQFNTIVFAFCYCYYSISIRPISTVGWAFWAAYRIYELIRKAVSAHVSTNEAQAVLTWVGKLLIHCEVNTEEKLKMFALQIKHRSTPITALGLFPIDGSFAFTIIGASTTYITIIYQFQVSKATYC